MPLSLFGGASSDTGDERRAHRRIDLRFPLEFIRVNPPGCNRPGLTQNISTGGVLFETSDRDLSVGTQLDLSMTVPAAEGIAPYPGQASCRAEVVRLIMPADVKPSDDGRWSVAARFVSQLRLLYGL